MELRKELFDIFVPGGQKLREAAQTRSEQKTDLESILGKKKMLQRVSAGLLTIDHYAREGVATTITDPVNAKHMQNKLYAYAAQEFQDAYYRMEQLHDAETEPTIIEQHTYVLASLDALGQQYVPEGTLVVDAQSLDELHERIGVLQVELKRIAALYDPAIDTHKQGVGQANRELYQRVGLSTAGLLVPFVMGAYIVKHLPQSFQAVASVVKKSS